MQINSDELHFLVGSYAVLENMSRTPALQTFSKRVVDFFFGAIQRNIEG